MPFEGKPCVRWRKRNFARHGTAAQGSPHILQRPEVTAAREARKFNSKDESKSDSLQSVQRSRQYTAHLLDRFKYNRLDKNIGPKILGIPSPCISSFPPCHSLFYQVQYNVLNQDHHAGYLLALVLYCDSL